MLIQTQLISVSHRDGAGGQMLVVSGVVVRVIKSNESRCDGLLRKH